MTQWGSTSMHGVRRVAIFRTKGATKPTSKLKNLNYKDLIEGIGYKEDKRSKQRTAANISDTKIIDDDRTNGRQSHNDFVHERGILNPIKCVLVPVSEQSCLCISHQQLCKANAHHRVILLSTGLGIDSPRLAEPLTCQLESGLIDLPITFDDVNLATGAVGK